MLGAELSAEQWEELGSDIDVIVDKLATSEVGREQAVTV